jgi:hypothetical protein
LRLLNRLLFLPRGAGAMWLVRVVHKRLYIIIKRHLSYLLQTIARFYSLA